MVSTDSKIKPKNYPLWPEFNDNDVNSEKWVITFIFSLMLNASLIDYFYTLYISFYQDIDYKQTFFLNRIVFLLFLPAY